MPNLDDIELPNAWSEHDGIDTISVASLVKDCRQEYDEHSLRYLAQAQLNERMIIGDQFLEVSNSWEVQDMSWPSYVPKTSRNLLRNLSLTWSARVLEDRPWVQCFAAEPGTDQIKAQVASKVLEYVKQTHRWESMAFDASQLVQPHSCVGLKVVWDPLAGPPSPGVQRVENGVPIYDAAGQPMLDGAGEPQGDVRWEIVSIFDYGTDGSENIEDSRWCFFTKHVDEHDACHLLEVAGFEPKCDSQKYTDIWGVQRTGVEITELWWKPDYRFPQGLYAVVVGDKVVQAIAFPYQHEQLPLCVWKCGSRRGSPFGSTHVDDAVFIQRNINETVAALQQQARQIGSIKLLAHSSIIAAIEHGNQMIPVDDPEVAKSARWLEPPPRSEVLVQSLDDNVQALYAVYGLNEILSGAQDAKSGTSAKSIAYLNKLDSMKNSGSSRSWEACILRLARQTLNLFKQYVHAPRLMQIAGESAMAINEFEGADLIGIDVIIEPASGNQLMRGQIAGDAAQATAAGNPNPALLETAQTGIQDTAYAKASRDILRAQAEAALNGEPQSADPEVDPQLAVQEISTIMASIPGHPGLNSLRALLQAYQGKMGAMTGQQQQPPPQGAPQ